MANQAGQDRQDGGNDEPLSPRSKDAIDSTLDLKKESFSKGENSTPNHLTEVELSSAASKLIQNMRAILGRSSPGVVEALAEREGKLTDLFPLIWVVGPAAAGKSTVARFLNRTYPGVEVIHDRHALTEQLSSQRAKLGSDTLPTVVDVEVLSRALRCVVRAAESAPSAIIELARGGDPSGELPSCVNPMSFQFALERLSAETIARSLFVYVSVPFSERLARNVVRGDAALAGTDEIPEGRCSEDTMRTVFGSDDSEFLFTESNARFVELKNNLTRDDLLEVVDFLFGRKI